MVQGWFFYVERLIFGCIGRTGSVWVQYLDCRLADSTSSVASCSKQARKTSKEHFQKNALIYQNRAIFSLEGALTWRHRTTCLDAIFLKPFRESFRRSRRWNCWTAQGTYRIPRSCLHWSFLLHTTIIIFSIAPFQISNEAHSEYSYDCRCIPADTASSMSHRSP